jgi:hypothetical protein
MISHFKTSIKEMQVRQLTCDIYQNFITCKITHKIQTTTKILQLKYCNLDLYKLSQYHLQDDWSRRDELSLTTVDDKPTKLQIYFQNSYTGVLNTYSLV